MAQSEKGIIERKVKDCFARGWDVYFAVMNAVASGDWPGRTTYGGRDQRPLWGKRAVKMDIGVVVELPSPPPRSCSQASFCSSLCRAALLARAAPSCSGKPVFR